MWHRLRLKVAKATVMDAQKSFQIFVSSPGDVSEERALTEGVLRRLSEEYRGAVRLQVILWEHEPVFAHAGYQEQIIRPSECDLVICILWSRLGTRLPHGFAAEEGHKSPTGTEFEVRDALEGYRANGKPNLLIYRKTVAPQLNLASAEARERLGQYELLEQFCQRSFYDARGAVIVAHTCYRESYEFEKKLVDHVRRWLAVKVGDTAIRARWTTGSPYRGLQAFESKHREIYFGRSQALSELVHRLREIESRAVSGISVKRFLLVQGMSGNGKSSLIRAGLLPLLEDRAIEGIAFWRQVILKPSQRSNWQGAGGMVGALAAALREASAVLREHHQDVATLVQKVRTSPIESAARLDGYLSQEAIQAGIRPSQFRLMIFIDQLEEIFDQSIGEDERASFIAIISALANEARIWIIGTVRSDFAARIEEHAALLALTREGSLYVLGPPRPDELADMIREPALAAGLQWESREGVSLDQAILRDAVSYPESLPLLEYALDVLYEACSGRHLTYAAYHELGGLRGGTGRSAEAVLSSQPELLSAFPSLMRSLVSVDENNIATRRYAPLTEIPQGTPARTLLEALVSRRLCVADMRGEGPVVSFSHEALISSWPRVSEWLTSEASLLQTRELAQRDSRQWQDHQESDAWLAASHKLAAFRSLEPAGIALSPAVKKYISRSEDRLRRTRRRRRLSFAFVALLAVTASIAAWIAWQKEREGEHQTTLAQEAQLRSLTEAAAGRLKEGELSSASAIIIHVLESETESKSLDSAAASVFQEVRASDPLQTVMSGHAEAVRRAVYSPDGKQVLTASLDGTARIWDANTGAQLRVFVRVESAVVNANYSSDGTKIVTTAGGRVQIREAQSGRLLLELGDAHVALGVGEFSPDGTRVVTPFGNAVRIWSALTGAPILTLSGHDDRVVSANFSADGRHIVSASTDKTARIWDSETGSALATCSGHTESLSDAAFAPDSSRIVTSSADGTIRIWKLNPCTAPLILNANVGQAIGAAFSPDGKQVATGASDHKIRIWDATSGAQLRVLTGHRGILGSVAFSSDGTHIVSADWDHTARTWDLSEHSHPLIIGGPSDPIGSVSYSADGTRIVGVSDKNLAKIWDSQSGHRLLTLSGHRDEVDSAEFSPNGKMILTASQDSTMRLWDGSTGATLKVINCPALVTEAKFSPDGDRILGIMEDLTFGIWELNTGRLLGTYAGHQDYLRSAEFSPDQTRILTSSLDKTARIWDSSTGKQIAIIPHSDFVFSAEYSHDATRIVTADEDKTARVWNARSGGPIMALLGHHARVFSAAFSPDDLHIATGSKDNTVRIWDASTGMPIMVLLGHTSRIVSLAYSPDGRHLASASVDNTARIWNTSPPADLSSQLWWAQAAEADPLSVAEREQLGMPADTHAIKQFSHPSDCDRAAAAYYDPNREAVGMPQSQINGDTSTQACERALASQPDGRAFYQAGRARLAKLDFAGAKSAFDQAIAKGYSAALVDLGDLHLNESAKMLDQSEAIRLYAKAWEAGIAVAAFRLGTLYEHESSTVSSPSSMKPQPGEGWSWYQKGAALREPNALARFAQRIEDGTQQELGEVNQNEALLHALQLYAAAVASSSHNDWPAVVSEHWQYRRASLARYLALQGMMQEAADAYVKGRNISAPDEQRGTSLALTAN